MFRRCLTNCFGRNFSGVPVGRNLALFRSSIDLVSPFFFGLVELVRKSAAVSIGHSP